MAEVPEAVRGGTRRSPRLVTPHLLHDWPLPEPSGTKYSRGQAVVVGGARATPGGVLLAGRAALRTGAGRLSVAVADSIARHVAVALPECGARGLAEDERGSVTGVGAGRALAGELDRADAVLVGPGLDDVAGAVRLVEEVAQEVPAGTPVVLDAYGLASLPDVAREASRALRGRLVLTPNTGELAQLLEREAPQGEELEGDDVSDAAVEVARRFDAVVGCGTVVVADGRIWQVTTGDTGLGTSGSGDVVAGATVGLLSRGATPAQALVWAKYIHAAAGDDLVMTFGRVGYLASELVDQLPRVMRSLRGN
ncbi:NAD(P)H-hydrate dehydratase [Terrabacter sp. 2RAF25]|uniref:NAD(P)H-hydrate dehydratase n=1 Tax=Terrabacter sp. 2RAF25 TaxID=3232998 RepID=UPI003F97759A